MLTTPYLADVNLWLATVVENHPHHADAKSWWQARILAEGHSVYFCRITQLGLVRLLTNEKIMGADRQNHAAAWKTYEQLRAQRPVGFRDEIPGIDGVLKGYCQRHKSSPGFWTDAYLAAFAQSANMTLATFDKGFQSYRNLQVEIPS